MTKPPCNDTLPALVQQFWTFEYKVHVGTPLSFVLPTFKVMGALPYKILGLQEL